MNEFFIHVNQDKYHGSPSVPCSSLLSRGRSHTDEDSLTAILGPRDKPSRTKKSHIPQPSKSAGKTPMSILSKLLEKSQQKHHDKTRQTVVAAKAEIVNTTKKESDRLYSAIALSDRKQQKKLAEMDDNIKAISRALVFQNHQSQNSSNSGVPGVVVSVGGQSVSEAEQPSLLTEDDRTKQPSLPEFNRLREEKDRANLEAATYKKKQEALEAENRSLLKQLQAHSSKRVKRPEDVAS
eukprot:scaffold27051_cov113-Skeletonema_menzelii.AAC.8